MDAPAPAATYLYAWQDRETMQLFAAIFGQGKAIKPPLAIAPPTPSGGRRRRRKGLRIVPAGLRRERPDSRALLARFSRDCVAYLPRGSRLSA